jgi:ribosomal-protein-alanine N-acetyltransferase
MPNYQIETRRLLIRPWQAADRSGFARFVADAAMMRFITGSVWTDAQIDGFFQRQADNLARSGMCMAALCLRDSGELIGVAGAQPLDRRIGHDIGWWVWKNHWRQGYASEAAAAIRDHALQHLGLDRVSAVIDPDNLASIGVATRIGMRLVGRTTADQTASWRPAIDTLVFESARP